MCRRRQLKSKHKAAVNCNALFAAARDGYIEEVCRLIPLCDLSNEGGHALYEAAKNGHADCVEELAKVGQRDQFECYYADTIQIACKNGHWDCVKALIPYYLSDPDELEGAMSEAVYHNEEEIVRLLAAHTKIDHTETMHCAVSNGNASIVRMLIPCSNPKADNSYALRHSICDLEIFEMLLHHSDPSANDWDVVRECMISGQHETIKLMLHLIDEEGLKHCLSDSSICWDEECVEPMQAALAAFERSRSDREAMLEAIGDQTDAAPVNKRRM